MNENSDQSGKPTVEVKCETAGPILLEIYIASENETPQDHRRSQPMWPSRIGWVTLCARDQASGRLLCDIGGRSLSAAFEIASVMLRGIV